MDLHWWCCECDTTNSSPDDEHLVCSQEGCDHHLCSDCYNPQEVGRDSHLNDHAVVSTRTTISKAVVNDARYDEHRMKKKRAHIFKAARRLTGRHMMKHSRIGRKVLSFWSYTQRKMGRKEKLRIEGRHIPTVVVTSTTQNTSSTSHYYEPQEATQYSEESYYHHS